jgi:hypothetical protein
MVDFYNLVILSSEVLKSSVYRAVLLSTLIESVNYNLSYTIQKFNIITGMVEMVEILNNNYIYEKYKNKEEAFYFKNELLHYNLLEDITQKEASDRIIEIINPNILLKIIDMFKMLNTYE